MQQVSLSTATNPCIRPKPSISGTSPHNYIVQAKEIDTRLYCGLFGTVKLRKTTQFVETRRNTPAKAISEEKRLLYVPSFLRMTLELRYDRGFSLVPKSLHFVQVLSEDFMWEMCFPGNMEHFTQALSRGRFSPFARSETGRTWLHLAGACDNPELCSLLVKIGVDPAQMDDNGAKALHEVCNPSSSQVDTMRVLATWQDHISAEDFPLLFDDSFSGSPECVDLLLSTYSYSDETFHASIQDFSLLRIAVREYGSGDTNWGSSIRKWLRRKPDIHTRSFSSKGLARYGVMADRACRSDFLLQHQEMTFTLLDELFVLNNDPFQAEFLAQEWLLMLAEADYDINTYLENEKRLHFTQNFLSYPEFSSYCFNIYRQLVFEIGENPKVSWKWWIDPLSHASLVLHEFGYMNPCHYDRFLGNDRCFKFWEDTWPFDYPYWSENCKPSGFQRSALRRWRKSADQAARRHNRQAKTKYPRKLEQCVMIPGAWVEDGMCLDSTVADVQKPQKGLACFYWVKYGSGNLHP